MTKPALDKNPTDKQAVSIISKQFDGVKREGFKKGREGLSQNRSISD
ncbi:hypothetical protein [Acetobacterium wieringae]|nr:hypothetical protein [Acetobacterium wieringae]